LILTPDPDRGKDCASHLIEERPFFPSLLGVPSYCFVNMQTSARNRFPGKVVAIKKGSILAELEIELGERTLLVSHIAFASLGDLDLSIGSSVQVLVKSSQVILLAEDPSVRLSTRNCFCGTVSALHGGAINTEVILQIRKNLSIVAIVTNESARDLDLQIGKRFCAAFQPSSVLLALTE
jgi:molybdate transport system regulatory protein